MNTTLPIKVIDLAKWKGTMDGSDSAFNPHNLDTENLAFGKFDI